MSAVRLAQSLDLTWIPVSSSNLRKIAFARDFRRLFVEFTNNNVYAYEDVPEGIFLGLLAAPSKGQYLDRVLKKGGYGYSRVF